MWVRWATMWHLGSGTKTYCGRRIPKVHRRRAHPGLLVCQVCRKGARIARVYR